MPSETKNTRETTICSERRRAANHANAQKSTGPADKLFHRWHAARQAVLATEEETDYFEQQLADWMTDHYPDGFVLKSGKIVRIGPETK